MAPQQKHTRLLLDHQRMQMLEVTAGVSVEDASKLPRYVLI
jgi:hypothetical protein